MTDDRLPRRLHRGLGFFVRCLVASILLFYAAPKLLGVQFQVENSVYDTPLGKVGDMAVAWSFFAHSYYYQLLIGLAEIAVGFLLLFRRTHTLGVLSAVPIVGNILLVDYYFRVTSAMPVAVVLSLGVAYLLTLEFPRLKAFFWDGQPAGGSRALVGSATYGVAVLAAGAGLIVYLEGTSDQTLEGAYRIERHTVDGAPLALSAGPIGRGPMLYLDFGDRATLSRNGTQSVGTFRFDALTRTFAWAIDRTAPDSVLKGTYRSDSKALVLKAKRGGSDVEVVLRRVGVGKPCNGYGGVVCRRK